MQRQARGVRPRPKQAAVQGLQAAAPHLAPSAPRKASTSRTTASGLDTKRLKSTTSRLCRGGTQGVRAGPHRDAGQAAPNVQHRHDALIYARGAAALAAGPTHALLSRQLLGPLCQAVGVLCAAQVGLRTRVELSGQLGRQRRAGRQRLQAAPQRVVPCVGLHDVCEHFWASLLAPQVP